MEAVRLLLGAGANPNQAAENGLTPLVQAAERGNIPLLECLLAGGANPRYIFDSVETFFPVG